MGLDLCLEFPIAGVITCIVTLKRLKIVIELSQTTTPKFTKKEEEKTSIFIL